MVSAAHAAFARGNSGGDGASRFESISRKTARLHSRAHLRLSLLRLADTPRHRCHLDSQRGGTIFSDRELEAVILFLQQGLQGFHHNVGHKHVAVGIGVNEVLLRIFWIAGHAFEEKGNQREVVLLCEIAILTTMGFISQSIDTPPCLPC